MKRSGNPEEFLRPDERKAVEDAISRTEKKTSAEIKLVVARYCWGSIKQKAAAVFKKHGLAQTKDRNCVLILLILANREFLIYGDKGIHEKVGQDFWDSTRAAMKDFFAKNLFGEGLAMAINAVGEKLALFFPYSEDDVNEIGNEVSYDD